MRSFTSTIDEPMLLQIGDELPNLTRHTDIIIGGENLNAMRNVLESLQGFRRFADQLAVTPKFRQLPEEGISTIAVLSRRLVTSELERRWKPRATAEADTSIRAIR